MIVFYGSVFLVDFEILWLICRLGFPFLVGRGGVRLMGAVDDFVFSFTESTFKPAGLSGKRRRTVTLATVAQSQTFRVESSGGCCSWCIHSPAGSGVRRSSGVGVGDSRSGAFCRELV